MFGLITALSSSGLPPWASWSSVALVDSMVGGRCPCLQDVVPLRECRWLFGQQAWKTADAKGGWAQYGQEIVTGRQFVSIETGCF